MRAPAADLVGVCPVETAGPPRLPIQLASARTPMVSTKSASSRKPGTSASIAPRSAAIQVLSSSSKSTSVVGATAQAVRSWAPSGARLGSKFVGIGQ